MSQYFNIHPTHPQQRLLHRAVDIINAGAVVVYPTDSTYALACRIGDKAALERIRKIRGLGKKHRFTLVCRDLSEIATYAKVNNSSYRVLKHFTPGAFTFVLKASREVPRRLVYSRGQTIGLRIPDHPVASALLDCLDAPLMSTSLILAGDEYAQTDPGEISELLGTRVDLILDAGACGFETTTVIDLSDDVPVVLREGLGVFEA
ncbi:MAG: threonylcarbamoyl-AMP synthase [Pseudomonadales bacterium]|nr:threonylcarbamoyl-AMP synthase [Pseudomonadales bacterium]